jgi:hypothetical protein
MEILKWKTQLTCSYCSKILKHPIELPCDENICREHLFERDVVKQNRIKCEECNEEFQVKDNRFNSNKTLKKLVESQSYLSVKELSLKKELEDSLRKIFKFYEEFNQNKTMLESEVNDHFHEMRFQIDQHREELKKKIDDIALEMIDETQKNEAIYLNNLKEKLSLSFSSFSFDTSQSLTNELNQIEETFRDPNLLIQTIKEMQQKQEESLNEINIQINRNVQDKRRFKGNK